MELQGIKMNNVDIINQSNEYAIEVFDLTKIYKMKRKKEFIPALKNINLKIKKGEIFGLLGPNGAGKTTMVSILTTLIQPTSGYATILGHNILKEAWFVKENIGLMLGGEMVYTRLTGYRNLKFFCKLYGIKDYKTKINYLTEILNLKDWMNQYVSAYSKGMVLKLALARVLLIEPKILFLDEPMLGLDPISVKKVISILKNLNITIFLTSHQMDIVSRLCDKIAFLKEGKIIKIDTQDNFKKMITGKVKIQVEVLKKKENLISCLNRLDFISNINEDMNKIDFLLNDENNFPELLDSLKDYPVIHFNEIKPTLEDAFIKLTNQN